MPFKSVADEMHRYKHGQLHSGSHKGPVVRSRKQAIAIALSEQRRSGEGSLAGIRKVTKSRGK